MTLEELDKDINKKIAENEEFVRIVESNEYLVAIKGL